MRFSFQTEAARGEGRTACGILSEGTGLSRLKVKEAMQKGAVWLARAGSGERRLRRAQAVPRPGDRLAIHYDSDLLARIPPAAECRHDGGRFSVWFKPAGLLTQGSRYGDHCSLLRQAEVFLRPERQAFLVHRLDREAAGLLIIAHDRQSAAALSRMFAERKVVKRYRVELRGRIGPESSAGRIDLPLDGREATTEYTVVGYDLTTGTSLIDVEMRTGRQHQLRRHFAMAGFPVMGDPRHGENNKNTDGLKLTAWSLEFTCPFSGRPMAFHLDPSPWPFGKPGR
jgi:tRNA pseudouridine32 synthase/23S rRNA pseudouridine746 synthase